MIQALHRSPRIFILLRVFLICLLLFISFSPLLRSTASAAAVGLIPLAGDALLKVLIAAGVVTAGAAGTYELTQTYPYIYDTFYNLGATVSDWISALPEEVYYIDNAGTVYIGADGKTVVNSPSQLVIKGNCVSNSYVFPVNSSYAFNGISVGTSYSYRFASNLTQMMDSYPGTDNFFYVPFMVDSDGVMIVGDTYYCITPSAYFWGRLDGSSSGSSSLSFTKQSQDLLWGVTRPGNFNILCIYAYSITSSGFSQISNYSLVNGAYNSRNFIYPTGSTWTYTNDAWVGMMRGGYLVTDGTPVTTLNADKSKLEGTLVSVGDLTNPPTDPDPEDPEDPEKGYQLAPPSLWEIFTSVADLLDDKNNNTTLKDYVRNGYVYNVVDVDVNVPERFNIQFSGDFKIDANVNLGGGVTVDVNINDNVSLPSVSGGDGENFFGADAVDVFAGLTNNNPVLSTITALFQSIDPSLVAVFSVTVSLTFLLALWHLIRG